MPVHHHESNGIDNPTKKMPDDDDDGDDDEDDDDDGDGDDDDDSKGDWAPPCRGTTTHDVDDIRRCG